MVVMTLVMLVGTAIVLTSMGRYTVSTVEHQLRYLGTAGAIAVAAGTVISSLLVQTVAIATHPSDPFGQCTVVAFIPTGTSAELIPHKIRKAFAKTRILGGVVMGQTGQVGLRGAGPERILRCRQW